MPQAHRCHNLRAAAGRVGGLHPAASGPGRVTPSTPNRKAGTAVSRSYAAEMRAVIGASRSQGYGRYEVTRWDPITT